MSDEVTVNIECGHCGHRVQWASDTPTDKILICGNCGKPIGTLGQAHAKAIDELKERVRSSLKDALK